MAHPGGHWSMGWTLRGRLSRCCRRPSKRSIMKYLMLAILLTTIACARLQRPWVMSFPVAECRSGHQARTTVATGFLSRRFASICPGSDALGDARRGAKQLYDLFKRIDMTKDVFEYRTFTRLKQLEYLIQTQQIDSHFFWTNEVGDGSL